MGAVAGHGEAAVVLRSRARRRRKEEEGSGGGRVNSLRRPLPPIYSHGQNVGKWDRLRPPSPLPRIEWARPTHELTASRRATVHGRHIKYPRGSRGRRMAAPARCHVPSRAWPVRASSATFRHVATTSKPRGRVPSPSRFSGFLGFPPVPGCRDPASGSRHPVGVAGPGGHWPRRHRPPPQGMKLRRPPCPKPASLHSFGDYCRGDEPRAGNGTRILFKTFRASSAPQSGLTLAGFLNPA
jgi:hypothetical protein